MSDAREQGAREQATHDCCWHLSRRSHFQDSRITYEVCCYCPLERVTHEELCAEAGHGPRVPKSIWVQTSRSIR